jgi:hypothetical protein
MKPSTMLCFLFCALLFTNTAALADDPKDPKSGKVDPKEGDGGGYFIKAKDKKGEERTITFVTKPKDKPTEITVRVEPPPKPVKEWQRTLAGSKITVDPNIPQPKGKEPPMRLAGWLQMKKAGDEIKVTMPEPSLNMPQNIHYDCKIVTPGKPPKLKCHLYVEGPQKDLFDFGEIEEPAASAIIDIFERIL